MNNSSVPVDENNDSDAHCNALVDENHRKCWLWYKIEHYQLWLAMVTGGKASVFIIDHSIYTWVNLCY